MTPRALRIAHDLTLPIEAVTSTLIVYGMKGMGKTNLLAVTLEEMSKAGLRWCSIDPVGVHWGLRHTLDGRGDGIPCLILGGAHGDIPITPDSGEIVAELVANENVNVIVDCSRTASGKMWSNGERIKFVTAFATHVFMLQGSLVDGRRRPPLFVALDEAARYVPQNPRAGDKDIALCLGAWEQLVEEGRNVGIGVGLFTQRSARLNKAVAELADTMIAFRTTGPNSIKAIIDWLGEHVPLPQQREMIEQVRKLPVGTALVVSPGWLGFEGVVAMRARETFDSSATPKPGERAARVVGSGATVDLAAYEARMAETIERAKADDPKALRAEAKAAKAERDRLAADVERANAAADTAARDALHVRDERDEARAEVDRLVAALEAAETQVGLSDDAVTVMQRVSATLAEIAERSGAERDAISKALVESGEAKVDMQRRATSRASSEARSEPRATPKQTTGRKADADVPHRVAHLTPRQPAASHVPHDVPHPVGEQDSTLSTAGRKILTALAQHGPRTAGKIAHLTGYSPSGAFSRTMTALRASGYVEGTGVVTLTGLGLGALGDYERLPEGRALVEHWVDRLGVEAERRILMLLAECWPGTLTAGEIASALGYSPSGAFSRAMTHLRKLDLIGNGPERGQVKANDEIGAAWSE